MRFYGVRNEQAPNGHLAMAFAFVMVVVFVVFILVIVMHVDHGVLDRVDALAKGEYLGVIRTGVVQEVLQPIGLQAETDSQHDIRIRYPGDVAGLPAGTCADRCPAPAG